MPLYEYRCRTCGTGFEVLQRMGDGSEAIRCPECDAAPVERRFSTFAAGVGGKAGTSSEPVSCGSGSCCGGASFGCDN